MAASIVVVGIGALGSHVVQFMRNEPVMFKVVDCDRVERKNVQSQFHGKPSVGKLKVQGLQSTMQFLFRTSMTCVPHRLTADNVREILGGSDLVLDCLDNGESRRIVQEFVRYNNIPCLHGALSAAGGGFGRVVWDENFVIDDESTLGATTCDGGDELPFIALVSSVIAKAAQDFLHHGARHSYHIHGSGVVRL
jgi:predicted ThiF/HesA family dinucleotide-utilizing enzyme